MLPMAVAGEGTANSSVVGAAAAHHRHDLVHAKSSRLHHREGRATVERNCVSGLHESLVNHVTARGRTLPGVTVSLATAGNDTCCSASGESVCSAALPLLTEGLPRSGCPCHAMRCRQGLGEASWTLGSAMAS